MPEPRSFLCAPGLRIEAEARMTEMQVARLDASLAPVASWHSRAGGAFHGVTSAAEHDGALLVSAKGGGAIVVLDPADADAADEDGAQD